MEWFFVFLFLSKNKKSIVANWLEKTRKTCRKLEYLIKRAILHYLINNQEPIGGSGHEVVIDETFFKNGLAFLGGVDRTTKKIFIIQIYQRDTNTLNSLISRYVLPNSIIFTDCWAGYNNLENIVGFNYIHKRINHSVGFANALGETTNDIEGLWGNMKQFITISKT